QSLKNNTQRIGVELDSLTAHFAKQLQPSTEIFHQNFKDFEDSFGFDLVIGNPPYGSTQIDGKMIVNYFIEKGIDLLKENAISIQVVSSRFLDNPKNAFARKAIAEKAELLGAIRLPSDTFSGTNIATDILIFQKSGRQNYNFLTAEKQQEGLELNSYFIHNRDHILGDLQTTKTRFGERWQVNGNLEKLPALLDEILSKADSFSDSHFAQKQFKEQMQFYDEYATIYDWKVVNGEFYQKLEADSYTKADLRNFLSLNEDFKSLSKAKQAKIEKEIKNAPRMIELYEQMRYYLQSLKKLEKLDLHPEQMELYREELNTTIKEFNKEFGSIEKNTLLKKLFEAEGNYYLIKNIENTDILKGRVHFPYIPPSKANNINDAMSIAISQGRVTQEYLESLLGKEKLEEAFVKGEIFKDIDDKLYSRDEFLSGNIGEKIDALEELKDKDSYQTNALNALKEALPKQKELEEIDFSLESSYIPKEVVQKFLRGYGVEAVYDPKLQKWIFENEGNASFINKFNVYSNVIRTKTAIQILDSILNHTHLNFSGRVKGVMTSDEGAKITATMKMNALKQEFREAVFKDKDLGEAIKDNYNRIFNRNTPIKTQKIHYPFLGSNSDIVLRDYQREAVSRIIAQKSTLIDHSVGAGKTYTMATAAMELKRLGLSKLPLITAPNYIVPQFIKEFKTLYPHANILQISGDKKQRAKQLSYLTHAKDIDVVFMPHSVLEMVKLSPKKQAEFLEQELKHLEDILRQAYTKKSEKALLRFIENKRVNLRYKINDLLQTSANKGVEKNINFDDLGIDSIFVDEAHYFKNLAFISEHRDIRGFGNAKGSGRAMDLYQKIQYLQENNSKIVLATGTPISNSLLEVYHLFRMLDNQALKQKGIQNADSFISVFGDISTELEVKASGRFKETTRLSHFKSIQELSSFYSQYAHYVDVKEEIALPKYKLNQVIVKQTQHQADYMQTILERAKKLEEGRVDPREDNFLKLTSDALKAALDMRLIDKTLPDDPKSKVNIVSKNITELYKQTEKHKGTQLVFLDKSVPSNTDKTLREKYNRLINDDTEQAYLDLEKLANENGYSSLEELELSFSFSLYDDLKEKLIKQGVKENEIAFIHDYKTDKEKLELFERVNAGEIRVLIGSTQKMGAGMNVQKRIVGLHHFDAAWNPADLEQREGRILRWGNLIIELDPDFELQIYRYVTEKSGDAIFYQKLEQKATAIKAFRGGSIESALADMDVISYSELKAQATGDTRIIEEANLKREIKHLRLEKESILRQQEREKEEKIFAENLILSHQKI
ncbi:hypothetical protein CCZ01_09570, partial [Helicobacter monodelphidis]|uniref:Eco57I restriction-modification methylase domain-containing protein n=1 Tax=Helicobacter sp. 15-1451 TaxID=2004995 RepID=UPI000DCD3F67